MTGTRENPFQLIARFVREVISELRKVIWPNRKQMVTYTIVVFIFLFFMVGLIFGLDQVFSRGVLWLYG
ncbi:preprotein translocase subunit SecE [Hoyosella sp. G463]|uniref:Protein translocase subunit SecE n=1 Tax=Lolliginicoccus lacisalsi TaxID=2742202 RepID=A0A927JDM0_9ACTN|nr:preprotein translocase subunit SecE [Lolliginicoccus lacisalsi]